MTIKIIKNILMHWKLYVYKFEIKYDEKPFESECFHCSRKSGLVYDIV